MATVYVKRDAGVIVGVSKSSRPDHTETIDDSDSEFLAFKDNLDNPPPNPDAPLDAEELYDILAAKGILLPQDRPRPKKAK